MERFILLRPGGIPAYAGARAGIIVNMASLTGYLAVEGRVAYTAAKAGLIMLTQALGIEWADRGVRVVGLAPGVVLTEMVEKGLAEGTASQEMYERRTPMRRLGTPQEIAEAVLYLASDEASYIVGEVLRVDGGWGAYHGVKFRSSPVEITAGVNKGAWGVYTREKPQKPLD